MSPEELLDWAEVVKHAHMGEEIVQVLRAIPQLPPQPLPATPPCAPFPYWQRPFADCGCAMGTICMNTACPRRVQVTY